VMAESECDGIEPRETQGQMTQWEDGHTNKAMMVIKRNYCEERESDGLG
jgi:hypothetical protein